jgi:hypothetical protein
MKRGRDQLAPLPVLERRESRCHAGAVSARGLPGTTSYTVNTVRTVRTNSSSRQRNGL